MVAAIAQRYARQETTLRAVDDSDEELLELFLSGEKVESQEAFRSLVARHGPMVLGTCRHVLGEHHDAEDAFQATFLVLASKGATIRNRRVLAGWLHEVAHRIAVKARATVQRRRALERQCASIKAPAIEGDHQDQAAAWNELRPLLHDEVERLPERYRVPVILSYLEGKTNEEVAEMLGWPVGTVKGRLARARDLLRSRLLRRGLSLSAAFVLTALSRGTAHAEVVSSRLVGETASRAFKLRPKSAPFRPDAVPDREPTTALSRAGGHPVSPGANRVLRGVTRRAVVLIGVLAALLTASIWLARSYGGGGYFAGMGSAVSKLDAAWSVLARRTGAARASP